MGFISNIKTYQAASLYAKGKEQQAAQAFDKAYAGGITSARARLMCTNNFLRRGRFQQAYDLVLPVLAHKDKKLVVTAKSMQGIALWKLGEIARSVEVLQQVYDAGKSGAIYGTLGCVLIDHDLEQAEHFNLEAYEYDEDDHVVLDNLGQIYYRRGDYEKASEYLKKALERRPTQADSLYTLSQIERQQGNLDNAKRLLEIALKKPISAVCYVTQQQAEQALADVSAQLEAQQGQQ